MPTLATHCRRLMLLILMLALQPCATAGEINVSAAASLGNAFRDIIRDYEATHADSQIHLNLGASGVLLQQIAHGAPVDVYASADAESMDLAQQRQLIQAQSRHDFIANTLVVIQPRDSALPLKNLAGLNAPGIRSVAIGQAASVAAGRYAQRALQNAGLWSAVEARAVRADNVRQALDYVARGEAEAGLVYLSDALSMPDKVRIAFDVPLDIAIRYPIAICSATTQHTEAARFLAYVLSAPAQAVLLKHGFKPQ